MMYILVLVVAGIPSYYIAKRLSGFWAAWLAYFVGLLAGLTTTVLFALLIASGSEPDAKWFGERALLSGIPFSIIVPIGGLYFGRRSRRRSKISN